MGWLEEKVAKWARLIGEHAGPGVSKRVMEGHEDLAEASPEERAAWCGWRWSGWPRPSPTSRPARR